jgi:hypothetical protein
VNPHKFWRKGKFGDFDKSKKLQLTLSLSSDLTELKNWWSGRREEEEAGEGKCRKARSYNSC